MWKLTVLTALLSLAAFCTTLADDWKPAPGPLLTRWSKDVTPGNAHPEYPRPLMVREDWSSLNGLWDCCILPKKAEQPDEYGDRILVPYPVESALSGVMKRVGPENRIWYCRTFSVPDSWRKGRVLLHFGAVDWKATVLVNKKNVGEHTGGYAPFSIDITSALAPGSEQKIVVSAWDPTDEGQQPRGKQVRNPHGIWYTPTTGIWQSVWLEPVPLMSIARLKIEPDIDENALYLTVNGRGTDETCSLLAIAIDGDKPVARAEGRLGETLKLSMKNPRLWSPESPVLYDLWVVLRSNGNDMDRVGSYFGMRKIALGKDRGGTLRLFLNNKPLFQYGPLDQGFWPDGLYTAPTDEAMKYDIEITKKLGFNMARKHVKIEPARWYYWCDSLGLMVWQDMPSRSRPRGDDKDESAEIESDKRFEKELSSLVTSFYNHPSIVMWVPFNEGWGQYDTPRIVDFIKELDPTRLVNNTSGWTDRGVGDVLDIHSYPGPAAPPNEPFRAGVLGEFGGLGLPLKGHTWQAEKNWGYRSFETREALTEAYVELLSKLKPLIGWGLAAAVYTQTSDVEIEVNGLMTYDRRIIKMNLEKAREAALRLYEPPPEIRTVLTCAKDAQSPPQWRYTEKAPPTGWETPGFDDSAWKEGIAGFGKRDTPGTLVHTEWSTSDIWIRRAFTLEKGGLSNLHLLIHHDEDAEVYLNGVLVKKLAGYTTSYTLVPLDSFGEGKLKQGENTIAVHCTQTGGGQYIDAGLVEIE